MERISAKSLQQGLASRQRMLTRRMLDYCAQMARIVADIHAAGWAWRDCKPVNWALQSLARDRRPQANLAAAFKREILRFIKAIQRLRSSLA